MSVGVIFMAMATLGLISQVADKQRPQFYCLTIAFINTLIFIALREVSRYGLPGIVIAFIFSAIVVASALMAEKMA